MEAAKFHEIREKFGISDDDIYFYEVESNGALKLLRVSEYELLAQEGLKDVYDNEPDGVWEKCLER